MNLQEIIKNTIIQNQAPIGFDEFMNLALYHPKFGYYRAGLEKFGEKGDFITAPEVSDLFGFCLARQSAQILDGSNDILEFGAGSGVLAAQILFELGRLNALPNKYYILELSAELQHRQQQTLAKILPELMDRVVWLNTLPQHFSGVVIANEVLDAMPAKRIIHKNNKFYELGVGFDEKFVWQQLTTQFTPMPEVGVELMNGYTTEANLRAMAWIKSLYSNVDKALVLLIDYGMGREAYFHPQRFEGTLRCYYQHKANDDPFVNIGKQDITTSVNFSDIAETAKYSGFEVRGYATQAMFLISLGIDDYLLQEKDQKKRINLAQQVKQLVLPSAMGESFKVLALTKKIPVKLKGFSEQNLTHRL